MNRMKGMAALLLALLPLVVTARDGADVNNVGDFEIGRILEVMHDFVEARAHYDQDVLSEVLSGAYTEVSPIGNVDSRDEVLAFYGKDAGIKFKASGTNVESFLDDVVIAARGDTAIATARESATLTGSMGTRSLSFRASFFLEQSDSRWRIRHVHYTPILVAEEK